MPLVKVKPTSPGRRALVKVVIAGGTGQVGTALARALRSDGHQVVVLSRRAVGVGLVSWDGERLGPWAREIDGSDVAGMRSTAHDVWRAHEDTDASLMQATRGFHRGGKFRH